MECFKIIPVLIICFWMNDANAQQAKNKVPKRGQNVPMVAVRDTGCLIENDLIASKLKGKVKSVKVSTYESRVEFDEIIEGEIIDDGTEDNSLTLFDKDGYVVKKEIYDTLCVVKERVDYTRYPNGCMISFKVWRSDTLSSVSQVAYNFEKLTIEQKEYDNKNQLVSVVKSKLDKSGKVMANTTYNAEGKKRGSSTTYKKENDVVINIGYVYDGDDKVSNTSTAVYDYQNRDMFWSHINFSSSENTDSNTYGKIMKLNEHEEIIEERNHYDISITTCQYEYDENKNWIKRTEYKDDKPRSITKRVIEYY